MGTTGVGSEHLLLAVLRMRSPAQEVLQALGVTDESLHDAIRAGVGSSAAVGGDGPSGGLLANPAFHDVSGCALGLAAGLGAERAGPEHVLLAIVWQPECFAAHLLKALGVDLRRLPAALAARGVAVPSVPPPQPPEVAWGPEVEVPGQQVAEITSRLALRLPAGTPLAFNRDAAGHGWVMAEQGVDLAAQVQVVLAELGERLDPS